MTTTYDLSTNVGKVRVRIGDTNTSDAFFTDEEITVFLTAESDNVNLAAADCLDAMAAAYGLNASSEKIGDYSYTQKAVDNMLKMSAKLRADDASKPYQTWGEMDLESLPDSTELSE